jgi:hypothetical protein
MINELSLRLEIQIFVNKRKGRVVPGKLNSRFGGINRFHFITEE